MTSTVDLLIESRWLLAVERGVVLEHQSIAIDDGRIVAVGPTSALSARFRARETVTRPHHIVTPGFVNAHGQAATSLLRSLPLKRPHLQWRNDVLRPVERRWLGPDFVRLGTQLAASEMLRSGITCFADHYSFPDEVVRVAREAHLRVAVGLPISETPSAWATSVDDHFEKAERLWDAYRNDPLVTAHFAPDSALELSQTTLVHLRRVADQLDATIAMPVHVSKSEIQAIVGAQGRRPLPWLAEVGLLRPGFVALHFNSGTQEDLDLAARNGIAVVQCPQANLRFGNGTFASGALLESGIEVAFGTGAAYAAQPLDVRGEARLALLLSGGGPSQSHEIEALQALHRATLGGARVLGLANEIGSVEVDKAADLAAIDVSNLQGTDVAALLIHASSREDVTDVWVGGRALVRDRRQLAFDDASLRSQSLDWSNRLNMGAAA